MAQTPLVNINNNTNNDNYYFKNKYVKLGYHYLVSNALYIILMPLLAMTLADLSKLTIQDLIELWNQKLNFNEVTMVLSLGFIVLTSTIYFMSRPRKVYLVDFSCYKGEPSQMVSKETYLKLTEKSGFFTEKSLDFSKRILEKSGMGQKTYAPKGLLSTPADLSIKVSKEETEMIMFSIVDELLSKTGVSPKDIGIIVLNSSCFNPLPSLSAILVNHYKLKESIKTFNIGGMGCSSGLISIDLAKDLLQAYPNKYALVISTENTTRHWYHGNEMSMLLTNCLFRVGGAAILLSNRSSDRNRSKYELTLTMRHHKGDDTSYNCIMQRVDEDNKIGFSLSKDLMKTAGETIKAHITTLGPLVLPVSEQILFLFTLAIKKILKRKNIKPYVPDFKLAFEHFCIHAGGRGVLDELEKNLGLTEWHMEPSRMTLYRFGNTSSSSLWYELAYSEAKGRIKRGDRVWQLGFGSGFKCNSAIWKALRTINPTKERNPWIHEIDQFPVDVPKVAPIDYQTNL